MPSFQMLSEKLREATIFKERSFYSCNDWITSQLSHPWCLNSWTGIYKYYLFKVVVGDVDKGMRTTRCSLMAFFHDIEYSSTANKFPGFHGIHTILNTIKDDIE